ncbi:hypothetical protein Q4I30_006381 [Leishmania utingensis]|uniref:Uncharacterized protein n=1 Tax=Leishmania utingensis TaxID=653362 RepID=A0AAW3A2K3_9TRYP
MNPFTYSSVLCASALDSSDAPVTQCIFGGPPTAGDCRSARELHALHIQQLLRRTSSMVFDSAFSDCLRTPVALRSVTTPAPSVKQQSQQQKVGHHLPSPTAGYPTHMQPQSFSYAHHRQEWPGNIWAGPSNGAKMSEPQLETANGPKVYTGAIKVCGPHGTDWHLPERRATGEVSVLALQGVEEESTGNE